MSANGSKVESYLHNTKLNLEKTAKLLASSTSQSQTITYINSAGSVDPKLGVSVSYEDGNTFVFNRGVTSKVSQSLTSQAWYQKAKSERKTIVSPIAKNQATNELIVTLATPIYQRRIVVGVIASSIPIKEFNSYIQNATFPGSIAALYDETGLTISSTGGLMYRGNLDCQISSR